MPDSIRIKEIHEALQAETFAKDPNNSGASRVANIGYYVERIARVLGISVNPDGTVRSIRQKRAIEPGQPIPPGWNFGQWGLNKGGQPPNGGQQAGDSNEFRDGIVYEQRSNIADVDNFNPDAPTAKVSRGNYTLCENWPQYIDEMLDDLDKGLGWQELGAYFIPKADGSGKYFAYEGLSQLLAEIAFCISRISQHTAQTQIAGLTTQACVYELMRSTGQPIAPKSYQVDVGGADYASVPYPGFAGDTPTSLEQTGWILQNLAPILASVARYRPSVDPNDPESVTQNLADYLEMLGVQ